MVQDLVDPDALEALIEDSEGVPVVYGAVSTWGHLDEPHDVVFTDGQVHATDRTVTAVAAKLGAVRIDDEIDVDGVTYSVRNRQQIDDGALIVIALADA